MHQPKTRSDIVWAKVSIYLWFAFCYRETGTGSRSVSPKTLGLPSGKVKKASGVLTAVYANDGTIGDAKSSVSSLTVKATQKSLRRAVKLWFIGWSRRWKARDLHLTFNNGET